MFSKPYWDMRVYVFLVALKWNWFRGSGWCLFCVLEIAEAPPTILWPNQTLRCQWRQTASWHESPLITQHPWVASFIHASRISSVFVLPSPSYILSYVMNYFTCYGIMSEELFELGSEYLVSTSSDEEQCNESYVRTIVTFKMTVMSYWMTLEGRLPSPI